MALSTTIKRVAENLIEKFGTTATLTRRGSRIVIGPDWDPTYGTPEAPTIRVVDYDEESSGSTGNRGRRMLVSTSAAVTPLKGDKVTINETSHEIDKVNLISVQGVNVVYLVEMTA